MADTDQQGATEPRTSIDGAPTPLADDLSVASEAARGVVDDSVHIRGGPLLRSVATRIGSWSPEPVLVHGSLPGVARDLDLLVRDDAMAALEDELPRAGFAYDGEDWILVEDLGAVAVTLTLAAAWRLPAPALDDLFASALAAEGHPGLVRPAPHHDLLVLARRLSAHPGPLQRRHRTRITEAVNADPEAWDRAAEEARAWRCEQALTVLRDATGSDGHVGFRGALRVRAEERRWDGRGRLMALARAALSLRPRPVRRVRDRRHRGAVVALSGVDGSGKSTQARLVAEALWALGHETVIEWSRITFESSLMRIARPVKAMLRLGRRRAEPAGAATDASRSDESHADTRARSLRQRSRVIGGIWAGIVATTNGRTLRTTSLRHLRAGRIVVRDRYALDSVVQLEWAYANGRDLGWQAAIIRKLAPRPVAAFFLEVPPERAHGRKPEEFDVDALRRHSDTYARHTEALGVDVVDGARSEHDVFADLLRVTLTRLAERRDGHGRR